MNWTNLILTVQQMTPIEAVLVTIMAAYFIYKGGVNYFLPLIKGKLVESNELLIT